MAATGVVGLAGILVTFLGWTPELSTRFVIYLLIGLACSGMNVQFPGVRGSLSVSDVFLMLGVLELKIPEAVILAVLVTAAQFYWDTRHRGKRLKLEGLFFNTMCLALAVLAACRVYQQPWFSGVAGGELLRLFLAGVAYFIVNTFLVSSAIALVSSARRSERLEGSLRLVVLL